MTASNILTHWGPFLVRGDGDRVTEVTGHPSDPDPSALGQSLRQTHECRVKNPSIRSSWLESGPGARPEHRGIDPFVEVSWDEALDLVTHELVRVRNNFGHSAIFGGSYGWGSAGRFHMPGSQTTRFFRHFGGCTDSWGTYSSSAAEGIIPYIFGMSYLEAMAQGTSWSVIADHTELFVSFGGLRLSNTQVSYGGQGPHRTRGWMKHCFDNGVEFVNVSPIRDDIDASFCPHWVHPIPGTDVALMAALIHTLAVERLHDETFLTTHCQGWEELEAYILGKNDGTPKSADWASEITGLTSKSIRELARKMASKRTLVNVTFAVQRQDHGEQVYWMAIALTAVLGQIGLPGGGFSFPFGSAGNPGGGQPPKRIPGCRIPKRPEGCPTISVSRITELLEASPGDQYEHNGQILTYPDTRLVYWCGGNIYHHHQDLNRLNRAWRRPETIVVHEPYWTPMAKRSDIVLPATTPLERSDLGHAETMLLAMQPVVRAFGSSRDDYTIYSALAARLGFGEAFTEGRTANEWVQYLYEEFRKKNNWAPDYETFKEAGTIYHNMAPMGQPRQVFLEEFRDHPVANPLSTPSGRIELYSKTIADYKYQDCAGHPAWFEPFERLGTPAAQRHSLHLVSNQPKGKLHGQLDHGESSMLEKVDGREVCRLHPTDAVVRNISNGDCVRIFNDRGACLAIAQLTESIMPTVIQLSTGAWYDPDKLGVCKHGNPNVLTRDKGTSQISQGPSAHTCLVEVELFEEQPPSVSAFDPPQFILRSTLN